jgi:6-phosphogluconolactonase
MDDVRVFEDTASLFAGAADHIVECSREAITGRGRFTVALSGGSTPNSLYSLLATPHYQKLIDYSKWFVCWGDERMLPANDPGNNSYQARMRFLDHVAIPPNQIFPVPVELDPLDAASTYEQTVRGIFQQKALSFDLILLGMGDNGHTASLFPHRPFLDDKAPHVRADHIPEVNMWRITFNAPLINDAKLVLFLVSGKAKRGMLDTILHGEINEQAYPAQLIHPVNGVLHWYIDREAAGTGN